MEKYVKLGDIGGEKGSGVGGNGGGGAPSSSRGRSSVGKGRKWGSRSLSPQKRRKREESGGEEMSEEEGEELMELREMRKIGEKLRKFLFMEANRVSKAVSEFVLGCVSEYEECVMRTIGKNERLAGCLEECRKNLDEHVCVSESRSFANVVGKNVTGVPDRVMSDGASERIKPKSFAVVVKAMDENEKMTSEQVKEKVMRGVSGSLNVRVKAVRKTRSGGLAIEAASAREMEMLKECRKFAELGLKVEMPKRVGPKLIVFDVANEMTNDEFMSELYVKNLKFAGVTEMEFKERVRIVSRASKKGADVGNVIVEVSKRMRDVLMNEERVYVKWRACKVREFVNVMRCYKCFAFGHMMRECSVKERLCEKCGESGHLKDKCRSACVCRNCKMKGRDANHSVLSCDCPDYVRMLEREKARISDD